MSESRYMRHCADCSTLWVGGDRRCWLCDRLGTLTLAVVPNDVPQPLVDVAGI